MGLFDQLSRSPYFQLKKNKIILSVETNTTALYYQKNEPFWGDMLPSSLIQNCWLSFFYFLKTWINVWTINVRTAALSHRRTGVSRVRVQMDGQGHAVMKVNFYMYFPLSFNKKKNIPFSSFLISTLDTKESRLIKRILFC